MVWFLGIKKSNETEVLAMLEALRLYSRSFQENLIIESNSANAVMWTSHFVSRPWRVQFLFKEIKELSSILDMSFCHALRLANSTADVS